jgi:hypothetical protein
LKWTVPSGTQETILNAAFAFGFLEEVERDGLFARICGPHLTRRAMERETLRDGWSGAATGASCQDGDSQAKTKSTRFNYILSSNRIQKQRGFVYDRAQFVDRGGKLRIVVAIRERQRCNSVCSGCYCKRPTYDRLRERQYQFVPLWTIPVYFAYAPRCCHCPRCGVHVKLLPWAYGKQRMTTALMWFLASFANVQSRKETAARFHVSWQTVFPAVDIAVIWGRMHQNLDDIDQSASMSYRGKSDIST